MPLVKNFAEIHKKVMAEMDWTYINPEKEALKITALIGVGIVIVTLLIHF